MFQKSKLLLVSVLLSVVSAQVDLNNKVQYYSNGLTEAFHLVDLIRPAPHTYTTYGDTSSCIQDICSNGPSALFAYQISYGNLGSALACFCDNAVIDIAYMADNIGRVPYLVRKNVLSYTAASVGQGSGAYASAGKIAFFDQGENTEVFIHESAHVFDGSNDGLSDESAYYTAIRNDACVPDGYASVTPVEDFAQLTVTWTYLTLTGTSTPACLSQSINYLSQVLPASSILSTLSTYNQAPVTSAPVTSAPVTSAPVTSAPVTSAPAPTSCTIAVRQTLSNTWQSAGTTFTQYNVVFVNNGATDLQASNLAVQLVGGQISQIWNLEQQKTGEYRLPSYQSSIAAGNQYSWGYVVQGSSPLSVSFILPSVCNPSSTSAPVTSAPITSAPVTSAPVTSAPITSAPVTPAPTPSSTTAPGSSSCAFEIRQTLASTWVSNGITYSQFNVMYRNAGTTPAAAVVQLGGAVITQIWNVEQGANSYYYLPSYQSTLAPNAQYSWGYIAQSSNPITIRLIC